MKNMFDVEKAVGRILGPDALEVFKVQMDDMFCYAKALSLSDMESTPDEVEERFVDIFKALIMELAGSYLYDNYPSVNIDNDRVYDNDMNPIEPISELQKNQPAMQDVAVRQAVAYFNEGRALADKILRRYRKYAKTNPSPKDVCWEPQRDYLQKPPFELQEIEMMRLERKLPNLSDEEGRRLLSLYQSARAN